MALGIKQQALFLQVLGDMLEGGFSIKKSLEAIMENDTLAVYAENIYENFQSGIDFIDAIVEEDIFDEEVVVILRSSVSENIVSGIREAQKWLQMRLSFQSSVISAIIYPSVLLFVSHIVFYAIITVVIPKLEKGILTSVSNVGTFLTAYLYLSHHIPVTVAVNIVLLTIMFFFIKSGMIYNILMYIPGVSKALKIRASAMFFTILSILVNAGLPLMESLSYAFNVRGFEKYKSDIDSIQDMGVEQLFTLLYEDKKFDSIAHTTVQSGIASGSFEKAISRIAERESKRFEEIQSNLTKIIEPVVVAGTIASIAFLITPLYASILDAVFSTMSKY